MPREADFSLDEREFVAQALKENVRLDGRVMDDFRELRVSFGDEFGVADVRLGGTRCKASPSFTFMTDYPRVLTRVSAEVAQPFPERKFEGIFTIVSELSPMASPAFETGRQVRHLSFTLFG